MHRKSVCLAAAIAAVAMFVTSSTAFAGVAPIDGRVCTKVKDLKDPAAIVYTTNPVVVETDRIGNANCTLGKISSICWSSTIGTDLNVDDFSEECCFKAKCDVKFTPNANGYNAFDQNSGAGDFIGSVTAKDKASVICIPCVTNLN